MDNTVKKAIKIIKQGGIVIFPTDTTFGIGCNLTNEKAVERLFNIRKRPSTMAVPVLFDTLERVKQFVSPFNSSQGKPLDSRVEKLMNKYWPGALTIILPCQTSKVPVLVRGGSENLGVRIPDHETACELIKGADVPILGPSANFHGLNTPYRFSDLDKELKKVVDFVVEGKTKATAKGENLASTVIDCTEEPWKVLRQGTLRIDL